MTGPAASCPRCGHRVHEGECQRLGPVTCRPLPGGGSMRGRFPCGCTYTAPGTYFGGVPAARVCSCGQELAWALTEAGKPMPVERGSAGEPDGTLAVWVDERKRLRCRVLRAGEAPREREWRGRAHWGRCPDAAKHRKGAPS